MFERPAYIFRQPLSCKFEFLGLFIWSFPSDYIMITNIVLLLSMKTSWDEQLLLGAWSYPWCQWWSSISDLAAITLLRKFESLPCACVNLGLWKQSSTSFILVSHDPICKQWPQKLLAPTSKCQNIGPLVQFSTTQYTSNKEQSGS